MAKPLNRPFRALRDLKQKRKAPEPEEPPRPETFADEASAEGVERARPSKGRVSPTQERRHALPPRVPDPDHAFSVRVDADVVEGRRDDTEPVIVSWLLRQEPRAKLDLHGLGAHEARRAVHRFVRARAKRGDAVVLIVTGRGHRSKTTAVLKEACPEWLVERSMHGVVRAFVTAPPELGGAGALLVLLATE